jgi:hypothetical protein
VVERLNIIDSEFTNGGVIGHTNAVGSIAAVNHGLIRMSSVQNTTVHGTGSGVRIGGIVGINADGEFPPVLPPAADINDADVGVIEDVFFLSTMPYPGFMVDNNIITINEGPVSNNGGGIAGFNSGEINRVFYLAPAPRAQEHDEFGPTIIIYPIVRSGSSVNNNCIYLRGHRYSHTEGRVWINERYNFSTRPDEMPPPVRTHDRAGVGMVTTFIELNWLAYLTAEEVLNDMNMSISDMENWHQPSQRYPYPLINGMEIPTFWPEADSPVRPDQEDREDWAPFRSAADRSRLLDFVNGDFSSSLHTNSPDNPPGYTIPLGARVDNITIPPFLHIPLYWVTADMRIYDGWYTRPIPAVRNLFNETDPLYYFPVGSPPPPGLTAEAFATGYSSSSIPRWRLIEMQTPNGTNDFMLTDYLGRNLSRSVINPTPAVNANTAYNPATHNINVRTTEIRYAELNAETPGTLYQVLPSTPGAEYYYSFYHATNGYPGVSTWYGAAQAPADINGDRLNFFLSHVEISDSEPLIVGTMQHSMIRDNAMKMIRPCLTPRSQPSVAGTGTTRVLFNATTAANRTSINNHANMGLTAGGARTLTLWLNPAAWNTVRYGASNQPEPLLNNSGGPYDLSYHRGRSYLQPDITGRPSGHRVVQNIPVHSTLTTNTSAPPIYLYDVWVDTERATIADNGALGASGNIQTNLNITNTVQGGTRSGYGITFWSTRNLTAINAASSTSNIHMNGITQAQLNGTAWAWLDDAKNNVIGYWGIEYGWKHYYGEYTVPEGQTQTEFAFQAGTGPVRDTTGNYLDGVSFRSPAYLTIDKYVKDNSGNDVMFVKPNDSLWIELFVKNHGETTANNIVIRDQIAPFDEYIRYMGGTTISVTKVTPNGTANGLRTTFNAAVSYPTTGANAGTIVITIPQGQSLNHEEEFIVRFPIQIRSNLKNLANPALDDLDRASTLLYFIRNQGVVDYNSNFLEYRHERHISGSGPEPVQVFIDPVKLSKTAVPPIDGPFEIFLRVEDTTIIGTGEINTNGMITDLIPRGFRLDRNVIVYRRINHADSCTDCTGGTCLVPWEPVARDIYYNPDGSTRMTIGGVRLGGIGDANIRSIDYRYRLEYTGVGYGVAEIQMLSNYRYLYSDEYNLGIDVSVMLNFPKAVVGLSVRTRPDNFIVQGSGQNVFNITGNDNFHERLADDGYDVMPTVIFTDAAGNPLPGVIIVDGNESYDTPDFTASIYRGTWELEVVPKFGAGGNFTLYYRIMLTATKAGSPSFVLNSPPTRVNLTIGTAVLVSSTGLSDLEVDQAVDGKIIFTVANGTYPSTINPDDFEIDDINLPPWLILGPAERINNTTVEIAVTGTAPPTAAGSINLGLPDSISVINNEGVTVPVVPFGTVTVGPVVAPITVTTDWLTDLTVGQAVAGSIIYTLANRTFAATIFPEDFEDDITNLPSWLTLGTAVRINDTTVTIPVTGIAPPTATGIITLGLPSVIPMRNITGATADIQLGGTVTIGPIAPP